MMATTGVGELHQRLGDTYLISYCGLSHFSIIKPLPGYDYSALVIAFSSSILQLIAHSQAIKSEDRLSGKSSSQITSNLDVVWSLTNRCGEEYLDVEFVHEMDTELIELLGM
jgi:hypothetical protein